MARRKRKELFPPNEICIGHIIQRCVRRSFLLRGQKTGGIEGTDRRNWISTRLEVLAATFSVDILAYTILDNHLHIALRNRPDIVAGWSDEEVAIRWLRVYPGRRLEEQLVEPTESDIQRLVNQKERIAEIRSRLSDISWFMRSLAEPIARKANKQDQCTGRFWEGRFKAQRILDEVGVLACTMYIDLNPIRAAVAQSVESTTHTSVFDRIAGAEGKYKQSAAFNLEPITNEAAAQSIRNTPVDELKAERAKRQSKPTEKQVLYDGWLVPMTISDQGLSTNPQQHTSGFRASDKGFLHIAWPDYLELLRWTANREAVEAESSISTRLAKLLQMLGVDAGMWRDLVWNFRKYFGSSAAAGSPNAMADDATRTNRRWYRGQRRVRECFVPEGVAISG